MTIPVIVLLVLLVLKFLASTVLDLLNISYVKAHSGNVPDAFKSFMDEPTYKKGISYTIDKTKFAIVERVWTSVILGLVLVFLILPKLYDFGTDTFGVGVWGQSLSLIFVSIILSLPEIPFSLYSQFVIEQKYGFNNSTFKLWIVDQIKGLLLGIAIGTPILALLMWFADTFSNTWWIWGFIAVAIFQVLMIIIYPRVIVPLFNKLEDLPEGELKTALFDVAQRGGFAAKTIQVIDGSKRSSHSNAYFTGFGKFRRIVLFDTLIEQLTQAELCAVLAHEIGHYKKGHIVKMICTAFFFMFITFAFMGYLSKSVWFYESFGFAEAGGFGPIFLMYALFSGLFTFWLSPIENYFSRKNEYEADAFAVNLCGAEDLHSALRKLHKKNLGNLTPHPLYSAFYYSHPTLLERENNAKN